MTCFLAADQPREAGVSVSSRTAVPLRTYDRPLACDAASAGEARRAVRRELRDWGAADLVDDCSLIVTELVTNAVRHGDGVIHFRLGTNGSWVYGEVFDEGTALPRVCQADSDSPGGRGLVIVDKLADEWGVAELLGGGKIVWFLLGTRAGLRLL
ncbi:ATP-binding protein [Thermopolyspora sp. NPDC052614]|uniref:ATP-binding protein n=1 Tax=Thermopolyspora sp. NPDC052614 TaxID=3155682 RepID=UPI0034128D6C